MRMLSFLIRSFPNVLKHKTVVTGSSWQSRAELENALVNGTRYMWLLPGGRDGENAVRAFKWCRNRSRIN